MGADQGFAVLAGPRHPDPDQLHRRRGRADPRLPARRDRRGAVVASGDPQNTYVFQAIVSGVSALITGALTTPFTAGVDALLYVDQRIRREGFDVQLITAAQADAARTWPGATAVR